MKKIYHFIKNNLLYLCTLFLLMFIPLYPKLPLFDIRNTWVYVRAEDFVVIFVLALWSYLLFKRKISLRTPLTIPILLFWVIGVVSTFHGVLFIFPEAANVFPNVAFLTYLRHIEYMSLFFVGYAAMKDRKLLPGVIITLVSTFIFIIFYGLGQKYLGFPAFLTSNEEFAKGLPITLSQLSRVPSTFAGHYDLAAYLVLMMPILVSLVFGFKNWLLKILLIFSVILGLVLLSMTVSRVSFVVLFAALFAVLYLQNKKFLFFSIPIILITVLIFFTSQSALFSRFGNTIKEVSVLVDSKTGNPIGHVTYEPLNNFENKPIIQRRIGENIQIYTEPLNEDNFSMASPSAILSLEKLPPEVPVVSDVNLSNGENLPQGTGYINLPLSPVEKKLTYFFYEKTDESGSDSVAQVFIFQGIFLVKKAAAYDLSFTTRFQGEWPNAISSFRKNIFLGSGYGSVSLAVDNNYLRILGETGLLGIIAFFTIFLSLGIYVKKIFPRIESEIERSLVIGFIAGVGGLFLNAILIDVFEASKIAFPLWILIGIILGLLSFYKTDNIDIFKEIKKILASSYAVIFYLLVVSIFILSPMLNNFFVGDDFTWFRWVTDCSPRLDCLSFNTISNYFTEANGFFYRPGTKVYFLLMHSVFWFNQIVYHFVSILLHSTVAILFFFLAKRIFRNQYLAALSSLLWLFMSGYLEAVLWISSTGHLFNAIFILLSLLFFIVWEDKRKSIFFIFSLICVFLSLLFHELGTIAPLLLLSYKIFKDDLMVSFFKKIEYYLLFLPGIFYLIIRYASQSHWLSGDYNYSFLKLPLNVAGNLFGYLSLVVIGPLSLALYQNLRSLLRDNLITSSIIITVLLLGIYIGKSAFLNLEKKDRKIIVFGMLFFAISLIPFLGLGNITSRYSYLASFGAVIILTLLFKKLYLYINIYGKKVAVICIFLVISTFSLWHVIQSQQLHADWSGAGKKSEKFFTSIEGLYSDYWSYESIELHLVNVPIRVGEAWVFPVGLDDAIWFAFKNKNINIVKHSSAKEAFDQGAGGIVFSPVFEFNDDGTLEEVFPPENTLLESK